MVTDNSNTPEDRERTHGDDPAETPWTRADIHRAMKRAMSPVEELRAAILRSRKEIAHAIIGDATEQELAEMRSARGDTHAKTEAKLSTDDLEVTVGAIIDKRLAQRPRKRRGDTTCERLQRLAKEDLDFLINAPEREVADRIGRSTGTLSSSDYWQNKIKPKRAEIRSRKRLAANGRQRNSAFCTRSQAESLRRDELTNIDEIVENLDDESDL